jgi:hypothetical protein
VRYSCSAKLRVRRGEWELRIVSPEFFDIAVGARLPCHPAQSIIDRTHAVICDIIDQRWAIQIVISRRDIKIPCGHLWNVLKGYPVERIIGEAHQLPVTLAMLRDVVIGIIGELLIVGRRTGERAHGSGQGLYRQRLQTPQGCRKEQS